jgi:biotin carboxyl carrier protein
MEIQPADSQGAGEMSMPGARLRKFGLPLAGVVILAGGVGLFVFLRGSTRDPETKGETRVTVRSEKSVNFKRGVDPAVEYGIEAVPAQEVSWHPKIFVDGRVVPNPHATLEVRAPFAGVVSAEGTASLFRIGAPVEARQTLALLEARFSPLEKLDLKAKSVEAEARFLGAEEVLKIRHERVQRLGLLQSGSISRGDLDLASIQLAEARMQKDIALLQWNLWKQALESVGKKRIIVPIVAPITGEVAEIGAQPGANVEAGQLLVRIVDFRRVLVRLDFPLSSAGPPAEIEAAALEGPACWRAVLRGPAPAIEIALQKSSYFYEVAPTSQGLLPNWRPGLFVKAIVPDPDRTTQSARAIPASALLVHQGRTLVYVQLDERRYVRSEVIVVGREGDTLYVSSGVRAGERVVSRHAQVLLSEEFRSEADDD